jgi:hypothetical protein
MRQFDCPQCGAPVVFQSATAEAAVCAHCQSLVVRHDANVEAIGKMAVLPPDMSPLQIGARGEIDGLAFTLLGRMRIRWEDGSWNEWFVEYADQTRGWVGEAQGFFMVLRESELKSPVSVAPSDFKAEQSVEINGVQYAVTDSKPVTCLGGEGELPEPVKTGEKWQSIDLQRSDGCVATLEWSQGAWRFFEGKNASFTELKWQNLRQIPGWDGVPLETQRNQTGALNCPSCGGVVNLRAAGFTMTAVCSHCGKLLDTTTPQLKVVQAAAEARTVKPLIPLGQRGVLDGVEWEHIGFQHRRDPWCGWTEYLLFNPGHGFRWLTEFEGHWTLVDRLLGAPGNGQELDYQGRHYRMYSNEACEVKYVEGEFYWQVRRGEKAQVADYISPPFILSREVYTELNEVSWSAGENLEPAALQTAFGLPALKGPTPGTVGIVQPNPWTQRWRELKPLALALGAALFVVQLVSSRHGASGQNYADRFVFGRAAAAVAPIVTKPFQISQQGGVDITAEAAVDNSWLGFDMELIEQKTGARYSTPLTVEYYHGYDDGNWSEGGQSATATIPGVPPGTYTLALSGDADPKIDAMPFAITVKSGQTYWSNFFIGALALLAYPLYAGLRHFMFEAKRWKDSDYSPYPKASSGSDDD